MKHLKAGGYWDEMAVFFWWGASGCQRASQTAFTMNVLLQCTGSPGAFRNKSKQKQNRPFLSCPPTDVWDGWPLGDRCSISPGL